MGPFRIRLYRLLAVSFSLKIRPVLISQPARLQTTKLCYNKRLGPDFFFSGLRPRLSQLACLGISCSNFLEKNKRLLAV